MSDGRPSDYDVLISLDRSEPVPEVQRILRRSDVPYDVGVHPGPPPRVVFSVPRERVGEAREALEQAGVLDAGRSAVSAGRARFPGSAVAEVAGLFLLHVAVVVTVVGRHPTREHLAGVGGLLAGRTAEEPWRLISSLFLHVDLAHAFWNGVSMLVFAVPLLTGIGRMRTVLIYLAGGLCGGFAALMTARTGMVLVGSSGAVAALFGGWLTLALEQARHATLPRRARLRALGIGLLVLPSLLSPSTASGQPISVEAHLGGFVAGAVAGAILARIASARAMPDLDQTDGE